MVGISHDDAPSTAGQSSISDTDAERGRLLSDNDDDETDDDITNAGESCEDAERLESWHLQHKRRETRRWSYLVMVISTIALITVLAVWVHN
jgi:hypothetical protein